MPTETEEYIYWKNWVEQLQEEMKTLTAERDKAQDERVAAQVTIKDLRDSRVVHKIQMDALAKERDRLLAENQLLRAERAKPPQPMTLAELIDRYVTIWERLNRELKRHPDGVMAGKNYCTLRPDDGIQVSAPENAESIQIAPF